MYTLRLLKKKTTYNEYNKYNQGNAIYVKPRDENWV